MGVYLPNIDMPKDDKCVTIEICPDGSIWQKYRGTVPNAKAIPVPPHGRLIDAEAYKSLLRGLGDRNYRREKGTICDAIKFLHPYYAPTIIPADQAEEGE